MVIHSSGIQGFGLSSCSWEGHPTSLWSLTGCGGDEGGEGFLVLYDLVREGELASRGQSADPGGPHSLTFSKGLFTLQGKIVALHFVLFGWFGATLGNQCSGLFLALNWEITPVSLGGHLGCQ